MDPRVEFAAAFRELGCVIGGEHPIMDGEKHRITVDGDRRGELGGFYVAHLDGHPAGYIKNHRTGVEIRWKAKGYNLDAAEQAKLRAEAATKQQERAAEQARVYEETAKRLERELGELDSRHVSNRVHAEQGHRNASWRVHRCRTQDVRPGDRRRRQDLERPVHRLGRQEALRESEPQAWLLSRDRRSGAAREGRRARHRRGLRNRSDGDRALGKPAVAAFDAGNLVPVAQALHAKFPDKPVLIVADDDQAQERERGINPGRQKAQEAARAVGGRVVAPIFAPAEQRDNPKAFSDFNDLAVRSVLGRDGAASQLKHAYEQAAAREVAARGERPRTTAAPGDRSPRARCERGGGDAFAHRPRSASHRVRP